jgi:hypothetical protein
MLAVGAAPARADGTAMTLNVAVSGMDSGYYTAYAYCDSSTENGSSYVGFSGGAFALSTFDDCYHDFYLYDSNRDRVVWSYDGSTGTSSKSVDAGVASATFTVVPTVTVAGTLSGVNLYEDDDAEVSVGYGAWVTGSDGKQTFDADGQTYLYPDVNGAFSGKVPAGYSYAVWVYDGDSNRVWLSGPNGPTSSWVAIDPSAPVNLSPAPAPRTVTVTVANLPTDAANLPAEAANAAKKYFVDVDNDDYYCEGSGTCAFENDYRTVYSANGTFSVPLYTGSSYDFSVYADVYSVKQYQWTYTSGSSDTDESKGWTQWGVPTTYNGEAGSSHKLASDVTSATVSFGPNLVVAGTPVTGKALAVDANALGWVPGSKSDIAMAYQWLRDGQPISGATGATYELTAGDAGHAVSVRAVITSTWKDEPYTYSGSSYIYTRTETRYYPTVTATSAAVSVASGKLEGTLSPTIVGTPGAGQTLGVAGTPDGSWTVTYQWLRNGLPIAGATGATYAISSADYGQAVSVAVTASKAGYESVTATAVSVAVPVLLPIKSSKPVQVGAGDTVIVGEKLTAPVPSVSFKASYQWLRDGVAIKKATKSTYKVVKADQGHKISVTVTPKQAGYDKGTQTSKALSVKTKTAKLATKFKGTVKVGKTLTSTTKAPKGWKISKYQWTRDGKPIAKATKKAYKLVAADKGHKVQLQVTVKKSKQTTTRHSSAAKTVK